MANSIINGQRLVPGLVEKLGQGIPKPTEQEKDAPAFSEMFSGMINSVNELQNSSAQAQNAFLSGEPIELHQVMIKAEEAGVSMDLLLEIRNKLLAAYQEIIRMPM